MRKRIIIFIRLEGMQVMAQTEYKSLKKTKTHKYFKSQKIAILDNFFVLRGFDSKL